MNTSAKKSGTGILAAGRPSEKGNKAKTLASLVDKAETVRVNFDLDREQHKKLKIFAARKGKSVKEILSEYVEQLPNE